MTRLMHSIVVGPSLASTFVTAYDGTNSRNFVSKGQPASSKDKKNTDTVRPKGKTSGQDSVCLGW